MDSQASDDPTALTNGVDVSGKQGAPHQNGVGIFNGQTVRIFFHVSHPHTNPN